MATSKKKRGKTAARKSKASGGPIMNGLGADDLITVPDEPAPEGGPGTVTVRPDGTVNIETEDGGVLIDPTGASLWQKPDGPSSHEENLALKIDPIELARISNEVIEGVEADKQDRTQWIQMRAKVIELLGLKLEDPKGDVSRSALGMSTSVVRDPTMLQAVNMFRATAYGELCPSTGPVKVKVATPEESLSTQDDAQALQDDLNYYLTTTASEYYPDMFYMLWWTGLASGTFKKVYKCPLRRRPVSEFIDGTKLIVSDATDLKNAPRITQEVDMDRATLRAMQLAEVYRDINLSDPMPLQVNAVDAKRATISGIAAQPQRVEDQKYSLYESYCKLDIKGYEHEVDGKPSGLPIPYKVTIDTTSKEVLEVRRNWEEPEDSEDEDDEDEGIYLMPNIPFVAFPFSTGLMRTYGTGLGHEMGNLASALTALLRISIDGGLLGNYPGMVKAKGSGRDLVNEIMVPPGGCVEIDTGGLPIQQTMMPVPYKDTSPAVMQLMEQTRGVAKELGGTANMPVAEGRQDAPVGTTLAMIEQALKPLAATHRMLCMAQAEEFRLLVKLLQDDPRALWRGNKRPKLGKDYQARLAKLKQVLDDCDIEPVADPNVPSEMHRKLLALFFKQITTPVPGQPPLYDPVKVDRYVARVAMKMPAQDFDAFLAPPPPPGGPDPNLLLAQIEAQKTQVAQQKVQVDAAKVQLQAKQAQDQLEQQGQIEATKIAVGHHQKMAATAQVPQPPDPHKAAELQLKARDQQLKEATLAVNTQLKQREQDSKEAVEAFKIVQTTGIHPEAAGLMNQQMDQLAPFLDPAAQAQSGMGQGGVAKPEPPEPEPPKRHEAQDAVDLALKITQALRDMPLPSYAN